MSRNYILVNGSGPTSFHVKITPKTAMFTTLFSTYTAYLGAGANKCLSKGLVVAFAGILIFGQLVQSASLEPAIKSGKLEEPKQAGGQSGVAGKLLKGGVSQSQTPLLQGQEATLTEGTKVNLTLSANLNSEVSAKGDEVYARVSVDVKNGQKVLLPGGWYVHGNVTDICHPKRMGRDGYLDVEFDKLVSPDGAIELPFPVKFSTRDNELKAVTKLVAQDTGYMTEGAVAGALLSAQLTGIPVAIVTHGLSLAVGASAGAGLGLIGAMKRKGKIASFYPGDEVKLHISQPLVLPGFNPDLIPSARSEHQLKDFNIAIKNSRFDNDPFGDNRSKLLTLELQLDNHTSKEYSLFDLAVYSDNGEYYFPFVFGANKVVGKKIAPGSSLVSKIAFSVGSSKHKYWLILVNKAKNEELSRIAIN